MAVPLKISGRHLLMLPANADFMVEPPELPLRNFDKLAVR